MLRTWNKMLLELPVGGLQIIPGGESNPNAADEGLFLPRY